MKRRDDDDKNAMNQRLLWPPNPSEEASSDEEPTISQAFDMLGIWRNSDLLQDRFSVTTIGSLDSFQESDIPLPEEISQAPSTAQISEIRCSTPKQNFLLENFLPQTSEKPPLPSKSRIPIRETRDPNTSPLGAYGGARRREPRPRITSREKQNFSSPQKGGEKQGKIPIAAERMQSSELAKPQSSIISPNIGATTNEVRTRTDESFTQYQESKMAEQFNRPQTKSIYHNRCRPQKMTLQSWITDDLLNTEKNSKAPLKSLKIGRKPSSHRKGRTEPTASTETKENKVVEMKHSEKIKLDPGQMYEAADKAALKRQDEIKEETICCEMERLFIAEEAVESQEVKRKTDSLKDKGLDDFIKMTEFMDNDWIPPAVIDRIRRYSRKTSAFFPSLEDVETHETDYKHGGRIRTSHTEFFERLLSQDDPPVFVPRNYTDEFSQTINNESHQKDGQPQEKASDSELAGACGGEGFIPDNAEIEVSQFRVYAPEGESVLESVEPRLRGHPDLNLLLNINVSIDDNPEMVHPRPHLKRDTNVQIGTRSENNQRTPTLLIASHVCRRPPFYNPGNLHRLATNVYYRRGEVSAFVLPRSVTRLVQQVSTSNPHLPPDPNFRHRELFCLPYCCPLDLAYYFSSILGYFFREGFDIYVMCKKIPFNSIRWQEIIPTGSQMRWWDNVNPRETGLIFSVEQTEDTDDKPDE